MVNKQSRRASVIAVWGNAASGKSTFSAMLAKHLSDQKKHVILISGDQTSPMLSYFFPKANIEQAQSLGTIMDGDAVNNGTLSQRMVFSKKHSDIGVLAYAPGDNPYTYTGYTYGKAAIVIETASQMADCLILDCPNRVKEIFTAAAIEYADVSCSLLTADANGIAYYKANEVLLRDPKFHMCRDLYIAGNCFPYQDVSTLGNVTGHLDGIFPHTKDIHLAALEGKVFSAPTEKQHNKMFGTISQVLTQKKQDKGGGSHV